MSRAIKSKMKEEGKVLFSEIPGMKFYGEGNEMSFDATAFIAESQSKKTVTDYFANNVLVLKAYADGLGIEVNQLRTVTDDGNEMLSHVLALDFACFVVPVLRMYMYERLREVFLDGFSVSDRYLVSQVERLPSEFLKNLLEARELPAEENK